MNCTAIGIIGGSVGVRVQAIHEEVLAEVTMVIIAAVIRSKSRVGSR